MAVLVPVSRQILGIDEFGAKVTEWPDSNALSNCQGQLAFVTPSTATDT